MARVTRGCLTVLLVLALAACGAGSRPTPAQPRWSALRPPASPGIAGPAGWPVYRGTQVPFIMAYPPEWDVDETSATVGEITFSPRAGAGGFATIGVRDAVPGRALALARDRQLTYVTRVCEYGREKEEGADTSIAGLTFATATATCELERAAGDVDTTFFVGVVVSGGVEWRFAFQCDEDDFADNNAAYFTPMLNSLTLSVAKP